MSNNTGQQLDQRIAQLERELAFAREGTDFLLRKIDTLRSRLALPTLCDLEAGDSVLYTGGDFEFWGVIRAVFVKGKDQVRAAVESPTGVLLLLNPDQLVKLGEKTA